MRPKKKVTLQDVAAALDTSVVTVSNALSGKSGVSPELREKVVKTAEELGYVYTPKKSKRTETGIRIALLAGGGENEVQKALRKAAMAKGYEVKNGRADETCRGMFLCGGFTASDLEELYAKKKCPMVGVGVFDPRIEMDFVLSDAFHAAYERTRSLILRGVQKVVILGGIKEETAGREKSGWPQTQDRIYGCGNALFRLNRAPLEEKPPIFGDIKALAEALEAEDKDALPGAVLCTDPSDVAPALNVGKVREAGIIVTDCGKPDIEEMAEKALEILGRRIHRQDAPEGVCFVRENL